VGADNERCFLFSNAVLAVGLVLLSMMMVTTTIRWFKNYDRSLLNKVSLLL
jgi:hypothetical protein